MSETFALTLTPLNIFHCGGMRELHAEKTDGTNRKQYGLRCFTWAEAETEPKEAI